MIWATLDHGVRSVVREYQLNVYNAFATALDSIWRHGGKKAKLGLAISGGVDSMALASLCHEVTKRRDGDIRFRGQHKPRRILTSFAAFIVDHKLRDRSQFEARQVAAELLKLGIEPYVLELDWQPYGDPHGLSNVESVARRLRYQTLGRACRDSGINTLLVAHHADDQVETVMTRLLSNYLGSGLAGINFTAEIPECAGIYGLDHSGGLNVGYDYLRRQHVSTAGKIQVERGGVVVARPLLSLDKGQLIDICLENDVQWFEDHTNADPTVTLRNTVRFLNKSDVFPTALCKGRLSALAFKVSAEYREIEREAEASFQQMAVVLNLRSGVANVTISQELMTRMHADNRLCASILRKALSAVAPLSTIPLQSLDQAVNFVFRETSTSQESPHAFVPQSVNVAGVAIMRDVTPQRDTESMQSRFIFHRSIPSNLDRRRLEIPVWTARTDYKGSDVSHWSDWRLWDSRYWIRVRPPKNTYIQSTAIAVRFLDKSDLAGLRKNMPGHEAKRFNHLLAVATGSVRFTLPILIAKQQPDALNKKLSEIVVALPTLKWSVEGWKRDSGKPDEDCWLWDVRYKHVDLKADGQHKVISNLAAGGCGFRARKRGN